MEQLIVLIFQMFHFIENSDKTTLQNINLEIKKVKKLHLLVQELAKLPYLIYFKIYEIKKGKIRINGILKIEFNFLRNHFH